MVVKIMKSEENIEAETNAAALCLNELFIYKTIIPQFRNFLNEMKSSITDACAVPRAYFVDYKIIEELGISEEAILVMDNLMAQKFRAGPKFLDDEAHLILMVENIAKFHSISFAMRIKKKDLLDELVDGLVPYSFLASDGSELEVYKSYYKSALERLFNCILADKKLCANKVFMEKMRKMKSAAFDHPLFLMESFLTKDEIFCAILHGDYDQTNVLFQYESEEGYENPQGIRMIDFQETRFASPVLDLACFMYINMTTSMRISSWEKLIELYHRTIIESLCNILNCDHDDPLLEPYSYKNFTYHFRNNAFFGVMVAISSTPMMMSSEDETQRMSDLYNDNFESAELQDLTLCCGGKDVDYRIKGIVLHAFEKGYLDIFQ